jgi:Cu-Zn family superoxide dismutase
MDHAWSTASYAGERSFSMQRRHFIAGAGAAVVASQFAVSGTFAQDASPVAGTQLFELPGDAVFPEGVVYDEATNTFFVGSTGTGEIFRGDLATGDVSVFADVDPARPFVAGMDIDSSGRLIAAGGGSNVVTVLNSTSGIQIAQFTIPQEQSFLNDVAFAPDGSAYVTDSINPVLHRISAENIEIGGETEQFVDFTGSAFEYVEGFNANGIVITDDGSKAIIVQLATGQLYSVELATGAVSEIMVEGEAPANGDGMALDGSVLYVVRNADSMIARYQLNDDVTTASHIDSFSDDSFQFPTTLALVGSTQALVVNSQFNMGDTPEPPFTVSLIAVPPLPADAGATPEATPQA